MRKTLLALCAVLGFGSAAAQNAGSKENPLSVDQFLEQGIPAEAVPDTYVKGYIVGYYDTTGSSNEAKFTAEGCNNATNILLGGSSTEEDVAYCIPVQLPKGDERTALNLVDNPQNFRHEVILCGSHEKYFSANGLKNVSWHQWVGEAPSASTGAAVEGLNETFANIPESWTNVKVSGDKAFYATKFGDVTYAAMTGYKGTEPPFEAWLISPAVDMDKAAEKVLSFRTQVNGYGSTTTVFEAYVLDSTDPVIATKTKLEATFAVAPESGYSQWAESGNIDLSAYKGKVYVGFRYYASEDANYATWCVTDVKLNPSAIEVPETKTYSVAEIIALGPDAKVANQKVKGYIVGYVDGQKYAEGAVFGASGENVSATNLILADAAGETDSSKCIPVQLPSGDVRTALNLKDNPGNLGREATLTGNIEKYFGVPGFKGVTAYELGAEVTPPAEPTAYEKAYTVEAGKTYAIVTGTKAATVIPAEKQFGYLNVVDVAEGDSFSSTEKIGFTFEDAGDKTFHIKGVDGRYYYMKGAYNSFNVADQVSDVPEEGFTWTVDFSADGVKIVNVLMAKTLQYDEKYNSYGIYPEITHALPTLYVEKGAGVADIEATDAPAEYFNLQGVRVANPENGIFIMRKGEKAVKVIR